MKFVGTTNECRHECHTHTHTHTPKFLHTHFRKRGIWFDMTTSCGAIHINPEAAHGCRRFCHRGHLRRPEWHLEHPPRQMGHAAPGLEGSPAENIGAKTHKNSSSYKTTIRILTNLTAHFRHDFVVTDLPSTVNHLCVRNQKYKMCNMWHVLFTLIRLSLMLNHM